MPHIVIFIHEFISALQHLKHCCHIIGTEHSVSASNHCNSHVHGYGKKAYILKCLLNFKNNLINIGCATLYQLSMTYITVNNLSINSNYRILAAELNYRFTHVITELETLPKISYGSIPKFMLIDHMTRKYTYSKKLDSAYSLEWYYGSEVFYRFRRKFNKTVKFR